MLEEGGFAVAGEADSIQATLDHPGLGSTNVVLLDISLEQASGMDLILALRLRGIRVVIYSMHEEPAVVQRALAGGATGYVTKREAAQSLAEAIRAVASGGDYISSRAAAALAHLPSDPDFSPQQQLLYDSSTENLITLPRRRRTVTAPRRPLR